MMCACCLLCFFLWGCVVVRCDCCCSFYGLCCCDVCVNLCVGSVVL